jgi:hypothetical protein
VSPVPRGADKAHPQSPASGGTPVRAAKLREMASVTLMNVLYPVGQTSTMSAQRDVRTLMGTEPCMKPLIAMLGILVALAMMLGIYLLAYRHYRKAPPRDQPRDRGPG